MGASHREADESEGIHFRLDDRLAVSPTEAARLLGLSAMTVYRHLWAGTIRARKLGNHWLIPVAELRQILTDAEGR